MSVFIYEGDLQGARKRQLDFISEILESKGFKGSKVIIEPVGKVGENYVANVKRIVVKENGVTLNMVAKFAPENPMVREMANIELVFQNEHFMYTEVFPKFDQKQKTAGIPENERFRFAKCYGSLNEAPNEIIILEDLNELNFNILNRFEPLDNESVLMVLRNFAIYHALSFATRYQDPEIYSCIRENLAPMLELNECNDDKLKYFTSVENQALKIVDDRCKSVIKGAFNNYCKIEAKICKYAKESKYTVIQQGDAWTNNFMFRLENEVPVECILVDYQMVKENSPVYDITYMLFNSTTHKQRAQKFQEYIDFYHNQLDKALHNFGLKANLVYPKDRLDADLKMYGKLLLCKTMIIADLVTKSGKEAEKMKEIMNMMDDNKLDENEIFDIVMARDKDSLNMFRSRVEDLADSFRKFGLV